jgi:hypothetical protein
VVGHIPDLMAPKLSGYTDLVVRTRKDLEERRKFPDPLAMAMEMDPSHKPLGLVQDWGYSCLAAYFDTEPCIVELGPSSLEAMAEEYRNHNLEQKSKVGRSA